MAKVGLDKRKLSLEQQALLEQWQNSREQLKVLGDMADMVQELVNVIDGGGKDQKKTVSDFGALLMDIRETLSAIEAKKTPHTPDYSKPIVSVLERLQKALDAKDFSPVINTPQIEAPSVSVTTDLKGIEKILKSEVPKAFKDAMKLIPKVEVPKDVDYSKKWDKMFEWLESIDQASRMKPIAPSQLKVTNVDGTEVGKAGLLPFLWDDIEFSDPDGNGNYQEAVVKSQTVTVATLAFEYDNDSNVTRISRV